MFGMIHRDIPIHPKLVKIEENEETGYGYDDSTCNECTQVLFRNLSLQKPLIRQVHERLGSSSEQRGRVHCYDLIACSQQW